jgi:hypothetical protein
MMCRSLLSLFVMIGSAGASWAGYSQHWNWKRPPDAAKVKQCIEQMRKVLQASPVPLAGDDGTGTPLLQEGMLAFNQKGPDEEIGEPFVFPGRPGQNFCKTNGKPYDAVVVACLLVVMDHFSREEISFGSDGNIAEGAWDAGIELYKKVFGKEPRYSKESGFTGFLNNIKLVPAWTSAQLWIVLALLGFGTLAGWYVFHPRPDFQIHIQKEGVAVVNGKFPEVHLPALRTFFHQDLPMKRDALVRGWYYKDGHVKLDFAGPISDREQQRVRNFFTSLRLH